MDHVIWVDEKDIMLGEVPYGEAHERGLLHRIAVVYLFDKDGKILVQERIGGRLDHSSAGHVDPGESYLEAAERELEEELGVKGIDLIEIGLATSHEFNPDRKKNVRHIFKIFECVATPVLLKEDEIKSVFWEDPLCVYEDMKRDQSNQKYTGGFRASLAYFLNKKSILR